MRAYRCDECGSFFEGASFHGRVDKIGEWEVTHTIKKAPKPLAATAEDADDDEEDVDAATGTADDRKDLLGLFSWYRPTSTPPAPDFCERCADAIIYRANVLAVPS